nr:hypothetical protein [uncultured Ruegeria sp.]
MPTLLTRWKPAKKRVGQNWSFSTLSGQTGLSRQRSMWQLSEGLLCGPSNHFPYLVWGKYPNGKFVCILGVPRLRENAEKVA